MLAAQPGAVRLSGAPVLIEVLCSVVLAVCVALFIVYTWHWPLIGDVAMVDYLVLLMQHGMAPYRDIVDAQMPGTYLVQWAALHIFGPSAVGLRLFDFTLLAMATAAMVTLAWPYNRFAGFFAGGMLALTHGRDGMEQGGQRDLIIAVLVLTAYAFAFHATRRHKPWMMLCAGCCAGLAASIKPTALPLGVTLVALSAISAAAASQRWKAFALFGTVGLLLPALAVLLFLIEERALPQFLAALNGMWPYYASLARRPLAYLLPHSFTPLLTPLLLWLAVTALALTGGSLRGRELNWEKIALWVGLALAFTSYLLQGKGFPYHRYPELAFLLLLFGIDFTAALRTPRLTLRTLGAAGLAACALVIAPISVWKTHQCNWRNLGPVSILESDLNQLGGRAALNGRVQCLDTFGGCVNTLYRMRLVQSTGFLVDLFFWAPQQTPVTEEMRERFWNAIQRNPPAVFVVGRQDYPRPDSYGKLQRWPQFAAYLASDYALVRDFEPSRTIWWAARPQLPVGYRIYLRKDLCADHNNCALR